MNEILVGGEYGAFAHPRIRLTEKSLTRLLEANADPEETDDRGVEVEVYDQDDVFVGRAYLKLDFSEIPTPSKRTQRFGPRLVIRELPENEPK